MKKYLISMILLACLMVTVAGCSKKGVTSLADMDVKTNTTMVMNDGTIQMAVVEPFEQEYYSKDGLQSFVEENVLEYTKSNGADTVTVQSVAVKDKVATLKLNFQNATHYTAFNEGELTVLTKEQAETDTNIGDTLVSAEDGSEKTKSEALELKNCTVVVMAANGETLRVEGKVKFYTGGSLEDENTVKTASEGTTVVVFE